MLKNKQAVCYDTNNNMAVVINTKAGNIVTVVFLENKTMTKFYDMRLNEYDQRQLLLMKEMLELYLLNKIPIRKLINNLEGLLYCLQSVNSEWKDKFHEYWLDLEIVYAIALDRNETLKPDDPDIQEVIKQIRYLLDNCKNDGVMLIPEKKK